MKLNKLLNLLIKNYPITIFVLVVIVFSAVSAFKLFSPPTTEVYAKVQVGQGLWWATTQKPNIWLAKAIKAGISENGLAGNKNAEVVDVNYYPATVRNEIDEDRYNIFVTVKLAVSYNAKNNVYNYNRAILSIGSPIEINTPQIKITGAVIEISDKPFNDIYEEKIVTLTKKFAYPWEFNAIRVGDSYDNGKEKVFEVASKYQTRTALIDPDAYGNFTSGTVDSTSYIVITAKMKLMKKSEAYNWNEVKVMKKGASISLSTANFDYQGFTVADIR